MNAVMRIFFLFLAFQAFLAGAQTTIVRGKVTDASSGDPLPFVNIIFKGTSIGTTTDFDGNYQIVTSNPTDSLIASYIGYKPRTKAVVKGREQTINFQLEEEVTRLREVVVVAGENPAFPILRNVIRNKERNDKRSLSAYEYDTYSKIEIDIDNMTEKFRNKKIMQKITRVLDSVAVIAGEDGQPVLPI
ncbi:MAG: carboxypeptidase-like regulatory domain-containing protein, partial [Cyclobacteriaceae bacterium]|nr:carboxypeptidase-like regulatory domain-containing protein [Cyclobacteriaceae bacterium]